MRRILIVVFLLLTSACTTMKINDFKNTVPVFVIEDYFQGRTQAWGLFEDRFGIVRRQFVVDITGTWDGKTLILNEDFVYNDGEKENRVWVIHKQADGSYIGNTDNAVGDAAGYLNGNAFNWKYDFNLKVGDGSWKVHFDDWMFLQPNGVLLNIATVSRWGLKVGTVFLSFQKIND